MTNEITIMESIRKNNNEQMRVILQEVTSQLNIGLINIASQIQDIHNSHVGEIKELTRELKEMGSENNRPSTKSIRAWVRYIDRELKLKGVHESEITDKREMVKTRFMLLLGSSEVVWERLPYELIQGNIELLDKCIKHYAETSKITQLTIKDYIFDNENR